MFSASQNPTAIWHFIWSTKVAPKIKLFWSRAVHDILSMGEKLREKMVLVRVIARFVMVIERLLYMCCLIVFLA